MVACRTIVDADMRVGSFSQSVDASDAHLIAAAMPDTALDPLRMAIEKFWAAVPWQMEFWRRGSRPKAG